MHVLVTRPAQDAEPLLAELRSRGIEASAEPLLEIEYKTGKSPNLDDVQAILATSANGVRAFAQVSGRRDLPLFAVGAATARTAREADFGRVESASGDVEALTRLVEEKLDAQAGALLHVAGTQVAGDLGGTLKAKGFAYRRAVLYEAHGASKLSPGTMRAIRKDTLDGILFFSPRTAEIFVTLARKARLIRFCGRLTAFCLSPAVADKLRQVTWREIAVANEPEQESLLALIGIPSLGPWSDMTQTSKSQPDSEPESTETPTGDVEPAAASESADETESQPAAEAETPEGTDVADTQTAGTTPEDASRDSAAEDRKAGRRRSVGPAVILWTLLLLAILAGGLYAARPFWTPYLQAYLRTLEDPARETRLQNLSDRLSALEDQSGTDPVSGDALAEMESQRAELSQRVEALVGRVDDLEQSLDSVRQMVDATQLPGEAEDARKSIEELSQRIARIEDSGAEVADLQSDLQALNAETNRISTSMADLSSRLETVEESEALASRVGGQVRESLLAASSLRDALRSSAPFAEELRELRNAAGDNTELTAVADELASHADSGIPTLAMLRDRFGRVARDVTATESRLEGEGWVSGVVNRLSSMVSVRRTDFDEADGSVDAVLTRAEKALAAGDLMAAADAMAGLEGEAAEVAAGWLGDARARVAAERAMAMLHVYAVSLMSPSAK